MSFVTTQYNEKVMDTIKSWNYLIDRKWKEIAIKDIQILFKKIWNGHINIFYWKNIKDIAKTDKWKFGLSVGKLYIKNPELGRPWQ